MKRTYVLKNKKRFGMSIILLTVSLLTLIFANTVYGYRKPEYTTVTLKQGDTLWELALKYNKAGDIRDYIYKIQQLNNMNSSEVRAGARLVIPVEE